VLDKVLGRPFHRHLYGSYFSFPTSGSDRLGKENENSRKNRCFLLGVSMSKLTEIFLSLSQLRKVQLQFKKRCNSVQLHISGRKVQLHFFNRKVQLKHFFVIDLDLRISQLIET
jgi:hypothetical protein